MAISKNIGIVLSGGGAKGVAHAAILKVLEEHGIEPRLISGSSAGAMVGALYAAGYKAEEILDFFKMNTNVFRWQYFSRKKPGLLNVEKYEDMFEPWLNGHTFESLPKKLHICVTDVLKGKIRFFTSGELVRPILASAAVPGVFTPVEIEDNWYIDGGTMNNFPVEPLYGNCDLLLGSFVNPTKAIQKKDLRSTFKLLNRANSLSFFAASLSKFNLCDFVFMPNNLHRFGLFDTKKLDEIYRIGYEYASEKVEDLMKVLYEEEVQLF